MVKADAALTWVEIERRLMQRSSGVEIVVKAGSALTGLKYCEGHYSALVEMEGEGRCSAHIGLGYIHRGMVLGSHLL